MNKIIYGFHSVAPLLTQKPLILSKLYVMNERFDKRMNSIIQQAKERGVEVELVTTSRLNQLCNNANHQGIAAQLLTDSIAPKVIYAEVLAKLRDKVNSIIMILDGITDPQNLGSIIRTCDCMGVDAIIIPKDNSASINPVVVKVAAGATNYIPVLVVNNLARSMEELKECGYWIAGTSLAPKSVNLFDFEPDKKIAWVMGNEGDGIRRLVSEYCDYLVSIPMYGQTQSLNVAVAAGVVLGYTRNFRARN